MSRASNNLARKASEENFESGKDLSECELFLQLREDVRKLIEACTLSKATIAASLGLQPSIISAWLDRSGNGRKVSIENAKRILFMARRQPVAILLGTERLEKTIMQMLKDQYGNQDKGVF